MQTLRSHLLFALLLVASANIAHGETVNLDGLVNLRGSGIDQPLVVPLSAGTWIVTPISGVYVAFSPWDSNNNCDTNPCLPGPGVNGFVHYWAVAVAGVDLIERDDSWDGLLYATPGDALANATAGLSFTLAHATNVEFYIPSGLPEDDNRGGISLSVVLQPSPVPLMSKLGVLVLCMTLFALVVSRLGSLENPVRT